MLLIAVTLVAGCASSGPEQKMAKAQVPVRADQPRDSIEKERTGQSLSRTPDSMPQTTTDQPVGPLRDIPPAGPIP